MSGGRCVQGRRCRGVAGHSLVELLIAMALGLLASAAAISLYRGQHRATMRAADAAHMAAAGQAALDLIAQHVRMAGFAPAGASDAGMAPVFGCAGGVPVGAHQADACVSDASGSDGIALRYVADVISTWPSAEGNPTDCLGHNIRRGARGAWIENRFYASAANNRAQPELYCRSTASAHSVRQPVVEAVERLRVRYWLRGGAASVPAYAVPPQQWHRVVALDLCVVVRGASDGGPAHYRDCDGTSVAAPDRHRRRAFRSHVALRNAVDAAGAE